ncbi:MAG: DUF1080 domain-containing protein [Planctomycetes bacterium]|nr:DUF1080 domain-containing protein [Planctomycetota bacterium]
MTRHALAWTAVLAACAALIAAGVPAAEKEEGFAPLFNGRDLAGWTGDTKGYTMENGLLVCQEKSSGCIYTEKEYSDFHLKFEFRLAPGANNGVGIRAPGKGTAAYTGIELQILDDTSPKYADIKPYQFHGSVYGVVPAKPGHLKKVGEWNAEEVIARQGRIQVILNGTTIVDADVWKIDPNQTIDGRPHPGLHNKKGHIGLLGHGTRVEFRNVRIKELGNDAP